MTRTFLITTAQDAHLAAATGLPCGFFCYRISETGTLQRTPLPRTTGGGLLGIIDAPGLAAASPARLQQDILAECHRRGYTGVIFSFAPAPDLPDGFSTLCASLQQKGLLVFLPPRAARHVPDSRVILPGSLSGGTFDEMIADYTARCGLRRICLELQRCCHRFSIPADTPQGHPLSQKDLAHLLDAHNCRLFYSEALCTNYCIYPTAEDGWQFALADDAESILRRLQRASALDVPYCFLSYEEWGAEAEHIAAALSQKEE